MNILYINHYAGSIYHGMEFRPYYLAREWVNAGNKVRIMAADFSHLRKDNPLVEKDFAIEKIDGIEYQWIKTGKYSGNGVARAMTMFLFVEKIWINARKIADDFKPDLIIASSTYPLDTYAAQHVKKFSGNCVLIHEIHDMWPIVPKELYGMSPYHPFVQLMQWAENSFCRNSDYVVSILPNAKDYLEEHGMSPEKLYHIPNGINLADWDACEALPMLHANVLAKAKAEGKFIICFFGSFTKMYNIDILLQAVAKLNRDDIFVALVGGGVYKGELQKEASYLNLDKNKCVFLPYIPKKAIPSLTQIFDASYVGAVKDKMFRFGIGMNKLFDSMMSGKPILYAVDAPNDYVKEYNCGLSVEAENVEALAGAILALKEMSEDNRAKLGGNGKKAVLEFFNYRVNARRFLEVID